MKHSRNRWVAWALILLTLAVIVSNAIVVYLLLSNQDAVSERIRSSVTEEIGNIVIPTPKNGKDGSSVTEDQVRQVVSDQVIAYFAAHPVQNGKDGATITGPKGDDAHTPVKGIDYFDGVTPQKGVDYSDGVNGQDGRTLYMRCNTMKNQWEQRYEGDLNWTVQLDQDSKPVKCTFKFS